MKQLSLFDQAKPAKRKRASGQGPGVPNRNEVYRQVRSTHTAAQVAVLDVLRSRSNATAHEVAEAMHKTVNQISGRFTELANLGVIETTGLKRVTPSGSLANVWRIKETPRR